MELEGLGADIWKGIDAQDYVYKEKESWDYSMNYKDKESVSIPLHLYIYPGRAPNYAQLS